MSDTRQTRSLSSMLELWHIDAAGLGVCLLLGGLWYLAGLKPLNDARAEHESIQAQLVDRGTTLDDLITSRNTRKNQVAALEAQISSGKVQLQKVDQLNRRVADLNALAAQCGLRVDEMKPGSPTPLPRYTIVPVQLAGTGTFPNCARFLHAVHERFRDTGIIGFELRGEPESPDKPPVFSINLLWYADPPVAPPRSSRK